MTTKQKVLALAKKLGATIEYGVVGRKYEILVEAPPHYHWEEGDIHELVVSQANGFPVNELWEDIYSRMIGGVAKCTAETCSWADGGCEWWGIPINNP